MMEREDFERLEPVRVFSPCGPCLTQYRFIRENRMTVTVAFWNGDHVAFERFYKCSVHKEPCVSCTDHSQSQYRDGYMD